VAKLLKKDQGGGSGLTPEFLAQHGFF
jgi:hypothetical protein